MECPLDAGDMNTITPSPTEIELGSDLARVGAPETPKNRIDLSSARMKRLVNRGR